MNPAGKEHGLNRNSVTVPGRSPHRDEVGVLQDEGFSAGAVELYDGSGVAADVGELGDAADAEGGMAALLRSRRSWARVMLTGQRGGREFLRHMTVTFAAPPIMR